MLIEKTLRNSVMAFAAVVVLTVLLSSIPARAQSGAASYVFLIGSGSLCDAGDSGACPAVVKSAGGDSYEMSGAGMFDEQERSVTAAGTFTHRSSDGYALETGIWIANELVSFDCYGIVPRALRRGGGAYGPPPLGPMRSAIFASSIPAGGLAVLHIRLLPMWGASKTATLQVNCALGRVPAEHQTEGIRLAFEDAGMEFDEQVSGRTLFVLTRIRTGVAARMPGAKVTSH
jgi:hypothetical protein